MAGLADHSGGEKVQTKLGSFVEAVVNILIGYGVAVGSQLLIFPWFEIHIPFSSNIYIGLWFTVISLARQYVLRRWFNARLHLFAMRLNNESP